MARVMVVDDEQIVREILRRMLERDSHLVIEAESGESALVLNREECADVVVADLLMPEMDGLELISQLRVESPETRVVAMSGAAFERRQRFLNEAAQMGTTATLAKPFTSKEVRAAVKKALAEGTCRGEPSYSAGDGRFRRPDLPFCQS